MTNFIGVHSIEGALKKVIELGGKIVQPKQPVPGWGYLATCVDTENIVFGLFEERGKTQ